MYHVERDDLQLISKHDKSTPILQKFYGIPNNSGILFGYRYTKIFLEYWLPKV